MKLSHPVDSVLFVCMGNICRSPSAEAVFRGLANEYQLNIEIDSAGTIAYHTGNSPDPRSVAAGAKRGLDFSGMRARQVSKQDFEYFDLILAADNANLKDLKAMCPKHLHYKLMMILDFGDQVTKEVPDPYYGGKDGFEVVLDLLENSLSSLAQAIKEQT
ncbi:low molecular weight protein-tyrosine-phosphatase [Shewanella maritima]|uniref:low molecular weight protein-tyrosine-phosphatase n=1 Tax=Shewanella maritima TaxID=2520507 RepID=UPI003735070E